MTHEEIKVAARDIEHEAVMTNFESPTSLYWFRHFVESKLLEAAGHEVPMVPGD